MPTTLSFAPDVGIVMAAARSSDGLLLLDVAAGARGAHRIVVLDPKNAFAQLASFEVPGNTRSGAVRIATSGELLVTADATSLSAYRARTGERVWLRAFPGGVTLCDARGPWVLIASAAGPSQPACAQRVRGSDGALDYVFEGSQLEQRAFCVGPSGELACAWFGKTFYLAQRGSPSRTIAVPWAANHVPSAMGFDETGARLVIGGGNEVFVVDVAAGAAVKVLELPSTVRSVGFVDGSPWALDRDGRVRVTSERAEDACAYDLEVDAMGGFLLDRTTLVWTDGWLRALRVVDLLAGRDLYVSNRGVQAEAAVVGESGELFVGTEDAVYCVDPATCRTRKLASTGAVAMASLRGAVLLLSGGGAWIFAPADEKPVRVGSAHHHSAVSVDGTHLALVSDRSVVLWDLVSRTKLEKIELSRTGMVDTGEVIEAAFFTAEGSLILAWSSGELFTLDELRGRRPPTHRFPAGSRLAMNPGGDALYRIGPRAIERVQLGDGSVLEQLETGVDADIVGVTFSPSGRQIAVLHRDGRLAILDLAAKTAVIADRPATSSALLAKGELYTIDLGTRLACSFSRDERRALWVAAGTLSFIEVGSGRVTGQVVLSRDGGGCTATDGASFDWWGTPSKSKAKAPVAREVSKEVEARVDGMRLSAEEIIARRRPGLLLELV